MCQVLVGPGVGAYALERVTLHLADSARLPRDPVPSRAAPPPPSQVRAGEEAASDIHGVRSEAKSRPVAAAVPAAAAAAGLSGGPSASSLLGDGSGARVDAQAADPESKLRNNLLLLLCYLYVFQVRRARSVAVRSLHAGVVHRTPAQVTYSSLVTDVLLQLAARFSAMDLELLVSWHARSLSLSC